MVVHNNHGIKEEEKENVPDQSLGTYWKPSLRSRANSKSLRTLYDGVNNCNKTRYVDYVANVYIIQYTNHTIPSEKCTKVHPHISKLAAHDITSGNY